jgi:hypothetical protein
MFSLESYKGTLSCCGDPSFFWFSPSEGRRKTSDFAASGFVTVTNLDEVGITNSQVRA